MPDIKKDQQVHRNNHQTNVALRRPLSPSGWRKTQMKWRVRLRKPRNDTTRITIFSRSDCRVPQVRVVF